MDVRSLLGYSVGSPWENAPYNIINTNDGSITMSKTKKPLKAYDANTGKFLANMKPGSNYKFPTNRVLEVPAETNWLDKYQRGGSSQNTPSIGLFDFQKQALAPTKPKSIVPTEYVVKSGDNLSKISKETGISINKLVQANNISNPNVIRANQKLKLPTTSEPEEVYQSWESLSKRNKAVNSLPTDEQRITEYSSRNPNETYVIIDKKNAKMNLYKGKTLVKSYEVGTGEIPGDAQTVTKVKNGKTDWSAGNKSTGAGVYSISNIDPKSKHYYDLPAFNLKNDQGIEVATTIHGTPLSRRKYFDNKNINDNRMSNGCINGKCFDLQDLYKQVDVGTKVYVLPEDEGNQFQIIDGKPVFRVSAKNREKYNQYKDSKGKVQKGQGINQSINTLSYKPIESVLDEKSFRDKVFQWNDFNDEEELKNTTKPFINALVTNKQAIMKAAKIPSDVYNEVAKMSFGILGTESNFGDTHSWVGNAVRGVVKKLGKDNSSPDYKRKYEGFSVPGGSGAKSDYNSVGLTQIRWSQFNEDEKKALKEVGITSGKDFLNPEKAAIGTTIVLGVRYNQQLTEEQKKDIWTNLPTKWNRRGNYADRVKTNSDYLSFNQLDTKQMGGWLNKYK